MIVAKESIFLCECRLNVENEFVNEYNGLFLFLFFFILAQGNSTPGDSRAVSSVKIVGLL